MKRKLLLSVLLICIGILAFGIINASAETYGDLTYTVSSGKVTITYCNTSASGELVIPDSINGYPVVSIADNAFNACTKITSITIPDSVTTIDDYAFWHCDSLTNITIPNGVTSIGIDTFYSCISLTSISLPSSLTTIGEGAFSSCDSLTNITIPNGVTSIGAGAFDSCISPTSISLPSSLTTIGENAFCYCNSLTNIIIPSGVTSIGAFAFFCCNLTSITIPDSIAYIDSLAFHGCDLSTVYYTGTEEEWNEIEIDESNDELLSTEIIFNYTPIETAVEIIDATSTENSLKFISKASINENYEVSSFGTTFIPLWLFELGATNTGIVIYDTSTHTISNGQTFGATLSGIPSLFNDMAIVGKSFIKDTNGEYIWSDAKYASVNDTTLKTVE